MSGVSTNMFLSFNRLINNVSILPIVYPPMELLISTNNGAAIAGGLVIFITQLPRYRMVVWGTGH